MMFYMFVEKRFFYRKDSFKENSLYKLDITRGKYKDKHTDHGNKVE
jgi:hypothetical protein